MTIILIWLDCWRVWLDVAEAAYAPRRSAEVIDLAQWRHDHRRAA